MRLYFSLIPHCCFAFRGACVPARSDFIDLLVGQLAAFGLVVSSLSPSSSVCLKIANEVNLSSSGLFERKVFFEQFY